MITLLKLISYILFAYGAANMVVYANGPFGVFDKWRSFSHSLNESFGELFTCMMCLSTWIGMVFSVINAYIVPSIAFTPFNIVFGTGSAHLLIKVIMDMGMTSGAVWLLHNLEEAMERHGSFYEYENVNSEE